MTNWETHTWNKGGIRGNYGAYRDSIWNDLSAADTDGDGMLSRSEFNKITNKKYDIIGDSRAPHTGNYFDEGGAIQDALARIATRNSLGLDPTIMNQYGIRQDQETGDILTSAGFSHSAFGRGADDDKAFLEGYGNKSDWAGSHYDYGEFDDDKVPTFRYKWSNTNPWEKPKKEEPVVEKVDTTPTGPNTILDEARQDWEENANPLRTPEPKVGGRGLRDAKPIEMDRWMNIGVNPGRRLGVDLTPMEQLGSIPFVTAGQYDKSLNKTIPTKPGGRFYGFLQPQDGFGEASSMAAGLIEDMRATI